MTVPLWVLRQTILPHGARLQKRPPRWKEPSVGPTKHIYSPPFNPGWMQRKNRVSDTTTSFSSVNWNDARYWVGVRISPTSDCAWSKCRRCDYIAQTEAQRKFHKGCHKPLEAAYTALKKDMCCVICNAKTSSTQWGIPICINISCIDKWRFDMTMNRNLLVALRLTGNPAPGAYTTIL